MASTFQLKTNEQGQYFFHFIDDQGETLLMSGEYEEKAEAEKAIADVRVGSLMGPQIAAGKVASGESFFVIKDQAGQVIAKSILFDSQMIFDSALHRVKDNACIAEIADAT